MRRKKEIKIGATYENRGVDRTTRKVLAIGDEHRPKTFYSSSQPPDEPGVLFEQNGRKSTLYITSFRSWVGKEISDDDDEEEES